MKPKTKKPAAKKKLAASDPTTEHLKACPFADCCPHTRVVHVPVYIYPEYEQTAPQYPIPDTMFSRCPWEPPFTVTCGGFSQ